MNMKKAKSLLGETYEVSYEEMYDISPVHYEVENETCGGDKGCISCINQCEYGLRYRSQMLGGN